MHPRRWAPAFVAAIGLTALLVVLPSPRHRAITRLTPQLFQAVKLTLRGPVKRPNDWFLRQRIWPGEEMNRAAVQAARARAVAMRRARSPLDELWQFAGPSNVGGRITALAVHPDAPDTVYAGAAVGGVFKSIDGGLHFSPVFEEDFSLSIGALAVDPADPLKVWVGTGEANSSGDSYSGSGLYLTLDGGRTWQFKGLGEGGHIARIAIDPTDPQRLFVAEMGKLFGVGGPRGVFRSTDGGENWENVLAVDDTTGCIDIALNPLHPDTVYAVMWQRYRNPRTRVSGGPNSGIWRSTDGGDTWTRLLDGLPQGATVGRGGIALAASDPSRLYTFFADHPGRWLGAWRSDDGGDTWQSMDAADDYGDYVCSSFGWYFGQVRVDPTDPDRLFLLGVNMIRSEDGGEHWDFVFDDAHVDHHALWIDPNDPDHLVAGHDGGVNISLNGGWSSTRFIDLAATQFYAITADPSLPFRLYGGTQDNSTPGTLMGGVDDWVVFYYGDGFYTLVDPRDSDVLYACYQYGGLGKSIDGGWNWFSLSADFEDDRSNWMTPYVMDPSNPDRLYLGTYRIWRTVDGGLSWTPISPDLTDGNDPGSLLFGTVTTLAVSPADPQVIYAGTDDANVWMTTDGGLFWVRIGEGILPERWVTRVSPHPDSAGVVYVTFSGYREGDLQPYIMRGDDFGASWTDVTTGLPQAPVNDLIVDPQNSAFLYAGTDFGVFVSQDYGASWSVLGEGLPMSAVFDLQFIPATRELVAGTHGRGMWKQALPDVTVDRAPGAALPARLGLVARPNPFNAVARIRIEVPQAGELTVRVFNQLGREVRTLLHERVSAGRREVLFDGTGLASGTYYVTARLGSRLATRRVTLLK